MANENQQTITPQRLGELGAIWAPEVPPEVLGAVFKIESTFGQNPASYAPQGKAGNVGPGQISSAPGTHTPGGNSIFTQYFPSLELGGVKGNPLNPEHAAIAALRRMQFDYKKGNGDIYKFGGTYLGWSAKGDANGTTAGKYTKDIMSYIRTADSDPNFKAFLTGAKDPTLRDPNNIPQINPAQINPSSVPKSFSAQAAAIATPGIDIKSAINIAKDMQFQVEELISTTMAIGKQKADLVREQGVQANKVSDVHKEVLGLFGMDPMQLNSTIRVVAKDMQQNLLAATNLQQSLDKKLSNDPIYALLDGFSGNAASGFVRKQIETKLAAVKNVADKLDEVQKRANVAVSAGVSTLSKFADREVEIKAQMAQNEALAKAQELRLQYDGKANKFVMDVERQQFNQQLNSFKAEATALARDQNFAKLEQDLNFKIQKFNVAQEELARRNDTGSVEYQLKEAELQKKKEALAELKRETLSLAKMSAATGKSVETLQIELKKDPTLRAIVDEEPGRPSLGAINYFARQGKLDDDTRKRYNAIYRPGTVFSGANLLTPEDRKLIDPKTGVTEYALLNEKARQTFDKNQNFIVNDGTKLSADQNPLMANFRHIMSISPTAASAKETPSAIAFQKTQLAKLLTDKSTNGNEVRPVADADVVNLAVDLAKTSGVGPIEAARQASLYFRAAIETNNSLHQFQRVGLPNQTKYGVPLAIAPTQDSYAKMLGFGSTSYISAYPWSNYVSVDKTTNTDKQGNTSQNVQSLDLSNEEIMRASILQKLVNVEKRYTGLGF